jgi:hypothetical protein
LEESEVLCQFVTDTPQISQAQHNAARNESTLRGPVLGAMPALYYLKYEIDDENNINSKNDSNDDTLPSLSEWLSNTHQLSTANVIYMAINNVLIFDAYSPKDNTETQATTSNGNLLTQRQIVHKLKGKTLTDTNNTGRLLPNDDTVLFQIPTTIWEKILNYLPDEAVGNLAQVCKAWNFDFAKSDAVWVYMLDRHGWPGRTRTDFLTHYSVLRSLRSVLHAFESFQHQASSFPPNGEVSFGRCDTPDHLNMGYENVCIQPWSARHLLVGTRKQCQLTLFETITKADGTNQKHLRRLLCHNMDIYVRSACRTRFQMLAVAVDEYYVGCLLSGLEKVDNVWTIIHRLICLHRNDLLMHCNDADSLPVVMPPFDTTGTTNTPTTTTATSQVYAISLEPLIIEFVQNHSEDFQNVFQEVDGPTMESPSVIIEHQQMQSCVGGYFLFIASLVCRHDRHQGQEYRETRLWLVSGRVAQVAWTYLLPTNCFEVTLTLVANETKDFVLSFRAASTESVPLQPLQTLSFTVNVTSDTDLPAVIVSEHVIHDLAIRQCSADNVLHGMFNSTYFTCKVASVPHQDEDNFFQRNSILATRRRKGPDLEDALISFPGFCNSFPPCFVMASSNEGDEVEMEKLENRQYVVLQSIQEIGRDKRVKQLILVHLESGRIIASLSFRGKFSHLIHCFDTLYAYRMGHVAMAGNAVQYAPIDASGRTAKKRGSGRRRARGKIKDGMQRGKSYFG